MERLVNLNMNVNKKYSFFIVLLLIMNLYGFSNQLPIDSTNYVVEWDFYDSFFGEMGELSAGPEYFKIKEDYKLFYDFSDMEDKDFILKVKQFNSVLSYNFADLLDRNNWFDMHSRAAISFYPEGNVLDIVFFLSYLDVKSSISILHFDFNTNQVIREKRISYSELLRNLIYTLSQETDGVEKLFISKDLNTDINFYFRNDDLVNFSTEGLFFSVKDNIVTMNNLDQRNVYKDFYKKQSEDFPKMMTNENVLGAASNCIASTYNISVKSELQEGKILYSVDNLKMFSNIPWVPSMNYSDERIVLRCSENMNGIYICNGYFDENRQDLYSKNNRVKEIEIEYSESYGLIHKVILMDTANPQYIPLLNNENKEICIKILSVYKGTKYDDTCINCIIPVTEQPFKVLKNIGK